MGNFLKKLSLPKIFSKKQIVFLFLLFLIFALFLPASFTRAQWWGPLVKPFEVGIGLLLQLTLLMAEAVLALGIVFLGWIVNWTTSGGLSLTNPANNKIIETGWTLIRDFANIGFILGLVYIGLATALGIVGFQTKKIFGWLLLMALVINFTPLICGIIVDASNLVGKFFMEGMANWSTLIDVFSIHGGALMRMLLGPPSIQSILIFLSLIAFGFIAGFTLLIFAFLLLVRIVAIQILVILSPLAFLARIFPKTKSYFDTWWNQFLQWSFIGAIGGFFLYLSRVALYQAKTTDLYRIPTPDDPTGGVLGSLAPLFVVVVFLIIGLYITLQTSAMGANYVMGAAKTVGKKIPKGVKWVNERVSRKARQKLGTAMEGAKGPIGGAKGEGRLKRVLKFAPRTFSWAMRGTGATRQLSAGAAEAYREDIEKAEKEAKGKSLEKQFAGLKSKLPSVRIGYLRAAIKDKNIKDIRNLPNFKENDIEKVMKQTLRMSPSMFGDMRDEFPKLATKLAGPIEEGGMKKLSPFTLKRAGIDFGPEDREAGFENLFEKIIGTIKPSKIEQWDFSTMKEAAQSKAAHKFWTGTHLTEGAKAFGGAFLGLFHEKMTKLGEPFYEKSNPRLHKYLGSLAGQSLGMGFKEKEKFKKPEPAPATYIQPWEEKKKRKEEKRGTKPSAKKVKDTKKERGEGEEYVGGKGPTD